MISKGLSTYALTFALTYSSVDAKIGFGGCPNLGMDGFDKAQFAGDWYQLAKDGWKSFWDNHDCKKLSYSSTANGMDVTEESEDKLFGAKRREKGKVEMDGRGNGKKSWDNLFRGGENQAIVATDYTSYAVQLSCTSFLGIMNTQEATVLSRNTQMPEGDYSKATAALENLGYKASELSKPSDKCNFKRTGGGGPLSPLDAFIQTMAAPDWSRYNGYTQIKKYYDKSDSTVPSGSLFSDFAYYSNTIPGFPTR